MHHFGNKDINNMKIKFAIFLISFSNILFGQTENAIQQANHLGEQWKFQEAIDLLQNELRSDSTNPEIYYWLGRYSHYIVYDTRPFSNKSDRWSKQQILNNLQKAVEIDPNYGDAKYFLVAEYGARALEALKLGDYDQYKKELIDASNWDGFPPHAVEHGRNLLRSCDSNAILIVNGDAQFNVLQYVQVILGFRKDVSLVVLALLERPYYIQLIRDGVPNILKASPINISDNLVMEMHNYKWKEKDIIIPLSDNIKTKYNLSDTTKNFRWHVKPNVGNNKLWTGTAMLIDIIKTNNWVRPIYYSWFGFNDLDGLEDNMQIEGLTAKIFPEKIKGTNLEYNTTKFELLMLNPKNYIDYKDIAVNNQPRVSYTYGNLSRRRIVDYAYYLYEKGEPERSVQVIEKMNKLMPDTIHPLSSDIEDDVQKLMKEIEN